MYAKPSIKYGRSYGTIHRASRRFNGRITECTVFQKREGIVYSDSDIEEMVESATTNSVAK